MWSPGVWCVDTAGHWTDGTQMVPRICRISTSLTCSCKEICRIVWDTFWTRWIGRPFGEFVVTVDYLHFSRFFCQGDTKLQERSARGDCSGKEIFGTMRFRPIFGGKRVRSKGFSSHLDPTEISTKFSQCSLPTIQAMIVRLVARASAVKMSSGRPSRRMASEALSWF